MSVRDDHWPLQRLRKHWRAQMEANGGWPCGRCGRLVTVEMRWHVGHVVAHSDGGQATVENTRPEHARCNESEGGRRGAAVANARRRPGLVRGQVTGSYDL